MRGLVDRFKKLESTVADICKASGVTGLSLGILHHGEVLHTANFGHRDVEANLPTNSDTIYSINSMSKAMTAAAVGILVHERKMKWDTPVQSILPDFGKGHRDVGGMITMVDLMSHSTGFMSPDSFFVQDDNVLLLAKEEAVPTFNYSRRLDSFRRSYSYNNFAFAVAGLAIESLAKQDLGKFLKDRIFDPLRLNRTSTDAPGGDDNYAKSYVVLDDRTPFRIPEPKIGTGTLLEGAAGVKSTVNDLLHLYKAFLHSLDDQFKDASDSTPNTPFRESQMLVRGHNFLGGPYLLEQSYGLGWVRCQLPGPLGRMGTNTKFVRHAPVVGLDAPSRFCLYHQGSMPGTSTIVYAFPETSSFIVILTNTAALNDSPDWIGQLLVETLFDMPSKHDYVKLAEESARRALSLADTMNKRLEDARIKDTHPSVPLRSFTGCYFNSIKNFFIEVIEEGGGLQFKFQGLDSQTHNLRHYNFDTFTWQMTHNEAARKGRSMIEYPEKYYLFEFGKTEDGNVDRLLWVIENTEPEPEIFLKACRNDYSTSSVM